MAGGSGNDLAELATKLEQYLIAGSLQADPKVVEETLGDGMGRIVCSVNDPLFQRWVIYLSSAVNLRYRRLGWLHARNNRTAQRNLWRNVVDQSDLAVLNFCDTYHQLLPISDAAVWADEFATFLQSGAAGNIATHMLLFREAGFDLQLLDTISCELLNAIDFWISKVPEGCMTEEAIAHLTTFCSELIRYPKGNEYFLKASQLGETEETYDKLASSGGLEFVFTSAYQVFPLYPIPITKLFSSCASVSKEGANIVQNVLSSMACFAVQLPSSFPVTSVMQVSHQNDVATVTILQPWKPPGGLHLLLPPGTKGMVLSHWPENGAIQRILFTHKYNAFDWFAAVTSSAASDAVQLDDGTVLDLLAEVAKLFCGLAKNMDSSACYDTTFSILGPFSRLAPCLNAVRESPQLIHQVVVVLASVINFFAALAVRCPEEVATIVDDYWAPVLLGGLYGELLSTYECRFADFQITSAICSLMSAFLETKYYEWMYGDTLRKNLVALLDSFLHTALANVATWRFTYLKKRVDHLRNIYALSALIFDLQNVFSNKYLDSFNNLFIIDPLLSHISNSLPSKVVEFILSLAEYSSSSTSFIQLQLVQPSLQSLISAFLSCMLRLYRFINAGTNKWDVVPGIAIGTADLAKAVVVLTTNSAPPTPLLVLNDNNRRLCFDLVALIISVLGHNLSLNGLLSLNERKQFQSIIVDTISEQEKYVTSETIGNPRLLLVQSAMGLVEATMQFQPAFFNDISSKIRPLVMSVISRFELYQSLPSLYLASLKIIAATWRFGRHLNFAKQLVEENGQQNFWGSVIYPLESELAKDTTLRKAQIPGLLAVLDILSLEMFSFCRSENVVGLNANLVSKLTSVFENGQFSLRLESIFDYLLLNEEEGEFLPFSPTCQSAALSIQTFIDTLATSTLPAQLIKPREQLEIIDSCVSVCIDLLTDFGSPQNQHALRRTISLSRILLPSFLRAVLIMVRNWAKTAFLPGPRARSTAVKGAAAILTASGASIFVKCVDLCRMVLSSGAFGDDLPMRFDEPGILSLTLIAELLMRLKNESTLISGCQDWFPTLTADIITQMLATESDSRVVSEFFSAAFAVINTLLLNNNSALTGVLLRNEIFICKLVECTSKAFQDSNIGNVNIDALTFLLNVVHSLNSTDFGEQRQHAFSAKRIISSLANAFYNHTFLECALTGSQPSASAALRTATVIVVDIITAMIMYCDGERNFFFNVDIACTFLAVYNNRFVKLAHQLTPLSDPLHFAICSSWIRLVERITARLSIVQDQTLAQSSTSDLSLTEIARAFFMTAFVLLNNFYHSSLSRASDNRVTEDAVLRFCSCTINALLKLCPSLVHIIHGDLFRGGRQVIPLVEGDFSLISLSSTSPKQGGTARMRIPQNITFGFLFACFQTTFRRMRRASDGGPEMLAKQTSVDHCLIATVLHSLLQLIVSQAVLHLQLIRFSSTVPVVGQAAYSQQTANVAAQTVAFNDQLKPELGACFTRFRRFVSSLPSTTLSEADAEDYHALTNVYEQILCS